MLIVLIFLLVLIALDIAAMRWGYNSSDGLESKEWERRQHSAWPEEDADVLPDERPTGHKYTRDALAA